MAKFGFKFMQEPEIIEEEIMEEVTKPEIGYCIYCGSITDLVIEHDSVVKVYIPICKHCFPKFKTKEKIVEKMADAIREFVLA